MSKNPNLVYDVQDRPPLSKIFIFGFQQLLAIMAATIAVPSIIGLPIQIPAALLGAGVGTIIYLLFTRGKSPVFLGSSFAFLGSLTLAVTYGYCGIILGSIFAGLVYVIIALIIKFVGTGWITKLMPPVVIGPTVAIIGLSLAGSAMGDIVKASADGINGGYNLIGLLCGLVTFFTVVIFSTQKRFKMMKLIPFILGIAAGYIVAAIFSAIGYAADVAYLKIIDWSPLVDNFKNITVESFLTYPRFALIGGIQEIANQSVDANIVNAVAYLISKGSLPEGTVANILNGVGVAEVAIAFLPVAFVVFAEHIADHKNLGSIIGKDLVGQEPGLTRTLLGDGVGSMAGTIFGVCPNTTYGESVGCVAITKNASIVSIWMAAAMCIVLSFISPVMKLLMTIPNCVMGGVCLTLYGFIAVSGLKMFKDVDLNDNHNLFVVSAILIAGIGGLAIKIPYEVAGNGAVTKVITITSIATALILGIVTNVVLTAIEKSKLGQAPEGEEVVDAAPVEEPVVEENKDEE